MKIRQATRDDASTIAELMLALATFEKLPPPDAAAFQRLWGDAFPASGAPRVTFWVADVDDTVAAYAATLYSYSSFEARPTLYLEDLFVAPDHRRKGVATAILDKLEAVARDEGCGRMEWVVLDWNRNARALYEGRGATALADWLMMRRSIPQD